jgi:hypothetical protein
MKLGVQAILYCAMFGLGAVFYSRYGGSKLPSQHPPTISLSRAPDVPQQPLRKYHLVRRRISSLNNNDNQGSPATSGSTGEEVEPFYREPENGSQPEPRLPNIPTFEGRYANDVMRSGLEEPALFTLGETLPYLNAVPMVLQPPDQRRLPTFNPEHSTGHLILDAGGKHTDYQFLLHSVRLVGHKILVYQFQHTGQVGQEVSVWPFSGVAK